MANRTIPPTLLAKAEALIAEGKSAREAARMCGLSESGLRGARKRPNSTTVQGDTAELVSDKAEGKADLPRAEDLMRARGFDPDEWDILEPTITEWEGPAGEGEVRTYHYLKLRLRRKMGALFASPVVHVPALAKPKRVSRPKGEPERIVVEGDNQAPYFDAALDAAVTELVRVLQPTEHVFNGDLVDLPTISKHADHPAAMASAQECIDGGYHILRRRAEAAPNARRRLLKGNHCWRIEQELLLRAERMYGITPAGEDLPALSLRRLLHLDALGVEFVEHPLGWEHAEVEVVPGPLGLVVRHGWLTGANSAEKSLLKRGRSLIVNHGHGRQMVYRWDPSAGVERVAAMCATMSQARGPEFPHFAVCDDWLQGCMVVSRWPSGEFLLEHAVWDGQALRWRDEKFVPRQLKVAA